MIPKDHDARLISLPEGVQVMRDGQIRYHWYNQITDSSRHRLWGLMDRSHQLASNPDIHIWKDRRRTTTTETQPNRQEYSFYQQGTHRVETVTGENVEEARCAAAFLLNTSIEQTLHLPALPPLGQEQIGQSTQQRWRVETLQFGYTDIKYAATRREAREIRQAMLLWPQTEQSHVVDTRKPPGSRR